MSGLTISRGGNDADVIMRGEESPDVRRLSSGGGTMTLEGRVDVLRRSRANSRQSREGDGSSQASGYRTYEET